MLMGVFVQRDQKRNLGHAEGLMAHLELFACLNCDWPFALPLSFPAAFFRGRNRAPC